MATLSEHFLIGAFADYYQELALAKTKIGEGKLAEYLGMSTTEGDQQLLGILHRKLKTRLTEQQRLVRGNATSAEQLDYLKVLYAACALTDEQLLFDVQWDQSEKKQLAQTEKWQHEYLMERTFFRTECAGSKVFKNIEEILTDRSKVSNRSDLSAVYLLTITLGFQGKYRGWESVQDHSEQEESDNEQNGQHNENDSDSADISISEPGPLDREKEKLYRAMDKPLGQEYVFAEAYQHLLRMEEDPEKQRIAPLKRWYKYALYALVGYLVLSTIVWFALTSGIGSQIDSLETAESKSSCLTQPASGSSNSSSSSRLKGDKCSA